MTIRRRAGLTTTVWREPGPERFRLRPAHGRLPSGHPMRVGVRCGLVGLCATLLVASTATAQRGQRTAGYAYDDAIWRFSHHDRPVKVVLLAGSIGAFRDQPYGRLVHQWCENAEVHNLSQVGMGAPQLLARFQSHVLDNPNVPVGARHIEMWLLFGGGLNSVGLPDRTNHAMHRLFRLAHRRNFRVVALTLTPWGDDGSEDARWTGARSLHAMRSTRTVVDFVMGRLSPEAALGRFRDQRGRGIGADAPWTAFELPDVAIDLYDSRLRDPHAPRWAIADVRVRLRTDARWRRGVAELDTAAREARLSSDATFLIDAPRWFLRPGYRSFDHIHPNRAGHRAMAETMCPQLPASWGCRCP